MDERDSQRPISDTQYPPPKLESRCFRRLVLDRIKRYLWMAVFLAVLSSAVSSAMDLPSPLTVDGALEFAWRNHPAVEQARYSLEARHGRRVQAGLWPRPELVLATLDKPAETEAGISIMQTIEMGGKRGARIAGAEAAILLADAELMAAWSDVRAGILEAFSGLRYARRAADHQRDLASADRELVAFAESMVFAGKLPAHELLQFKQTAAASEASSESRSAMEADARRRAYTAIGSTPPARDEHPIECSASIGLGMDHFDALLSSALTNSPALRTARAATAVARAEESLARASRWLDLRVGGVAKQVEPRVEGRPAGPAFGGQLAMDLPLWDRNQGNVAASKSQAKSAAAGEEAAVLVTTAEVSRLLASYAGSKALAAAYSERIVPLAQERHELVRSAFEAGKESKMALLKSRRSLLSEHIEQARADFLLAVSAIQLERVTTAIDTRP